MWMMWTASSFRSGKIANNVLFSSALFKSSSPRIQKGSSACAGRAASPQHRGSRQQGAPCPCLRLLDMCCATTPAQRGGDQAAKKKEKTTTFRIFRVAVDCLFAAFESAHVRAYESFSQGLGCDNLTVVLVRFEVALAYWLLKCC